MKLRGIVWMGVTGFVWFGLGCAGPSLFGPAPDTSASLLTPAQSSELPTPEGFTFDKRNHFNYEFRAGPFRRGEWWYRGSAPEALVARYYLEKMPVLGWTLESDGRSTNDARQLRFRRDIHVVTVEIHPGRSVTTLWLQIETHREQSDSAAVESTQGT